LAHAGRDRIAQLLAFLAEAGFDELKENIQDFSVDPGG
jgi:hypothetical protein